MDVQKPDDRAIIANPFKDTEITEHLLADSKQTTLPREQGSTESGTVVRDGSGQPQSLTLDTTHLYDGGPKAPLDKTGGIDEQKDRDKILDVQLPSLAKFEAAEKAAGLTQDAQAMRQAFADHEISDLKKGSLKEGDLDKFPGVGGAFVATGAVTEAEMDAALDQQKTMVKPPRIGELLQDIYKNDPDRLTKIQAASKFYDELRKN